MQQRTIGNDTVGRIEVGAVGLGAMPLSSKEDRPFPADAEAVVHAALDAGVTLIDTADAYAHSEAEFGHNESLVARALASYGGDTSAVLVATKGGHTRRGAEWELDGTPGYLRRACEASLRRLGVDAIGLYQFHRPDPKVPWAESVGALEELRQEGKVQLVGVSNADPAQIREAAATTSLAAVQNELSPRFRSSEPEVDLCAAEGIAFLPWSPLGGIAQAGALGSAHGAFAEVAAERGVSPQQVCLAWLLAKSPVVIPIPGARRVESILDSVAAAELVLSDDELARLDQS